MTTDFYVGEQAHIETCRSPIWNSMTNTMPEVHTEIKKGLKLWFTEWHANMKNFCLLKYSVSELAGNGLQQILC